VFNSLETEKVESESDKENYVYTIRAFLYASQRYAKQNAAIKKTEIHSPHF